MTNIGFIVLYALIYLVQFIQSTARCSYYPNGRYSKSYVAYCEDYCCSTSYPTSISSACCTSTTIDLSWWAWLLIGLGIICCLPCLLIGAAVICIKSCKSKNKGRVISKGPVAPATTYGNTTININNETKLPPYMANNLSQQSGMYQPTNPTAHPVNNFNYSSNMGTNSDQILPVLPPSTNLVDQSYKAY